MRSDGLIRVLIISDGAVLARALAVELEQFAGVHAVVCGGGLVELRDRLLQCHPDVIILDLSLHSASPIALLRKLRANYPVPIIALAEDAPGGVEGGVEAIERGALEVVNRPPGCRPGVLRPLAEDLVGKVRMAACLARPVPQFAVGGRRPDSFGSAGLDSAHYVVAIGASTGGTKAIETMLARAPGDFPPIVIVQHMPAGFTNSFAARLNRLSAISVSEAADGEALVPGRAFVARGDTHLTVRRRGDGWMVRYTHQNPVNRHCPSVDVLFDSVVSAVGSRAVGVLLTGMGADGAHGLLRMRGAGALTVVQDKASCVVYGMPKVAVDLGAAMHSAAPEDVPVLVRRELCQRDRIWAPGVAPRPI